MLRAWIFAWSICGVSLVIAAGCGGDEAPGRDTSQVDTSALDASPTDTAEPDTAEGDADGEDSAVSDTAAPDTTSPSKCGDGQLDPTEFCDGDTIACTTLATSYTGGQATCRDDCLGYEVSTCARRTVAKEEYVKPAERDSRWADARCSAEDAPYFFTVALTGSTAWQLTMEGGGYCTDTEINPCYARSAALTKDVDRDTKAQVGDGELRGDAAPIVYPASFRDANQVVMHYCSNDIWTGTRTQPLEVPAAAGSPQTMPFRFAGRVNVRATLEILRQRFGLDDADPELRVFFVGSSAGGHGVIQNLDQLARVLPAAAQAGRVHVLSTASVLPQHWKDVDADDTAVPGDWSLIYRDGTHSGLYLSDAAEHLIALFQSSFNPLCAAAHPEASASKCMFAKILVPFLTDPAPDGMGIPVAVAQNMTDPLYQSFHGIVVKESGDYVYVTPGGQVASAALGDAMVTEVQDMPWIYAPRHALAVHGIGYGWRPVDDDVPRLGELIDEFVLSAQPPPFSYVDFGPFRSR